MTMPDDGFDEATEHIFGNPEAPVTVVEYGDFECPYCAAAAPVLRQLVEESDGGVRLIFRNFPLPSVHPHALTAALAAEAAGAQGAYWKMHDLLYTKQDRLDDRSLAGLRRAPRARRRPGRRCGRAAVRGQGRGRLLRRPRRGRRPAPRP